MKLKHKVYLVSLSSFFANGIYATDGIPTNEELDKREQAAVELTSEVTKLSETYGRLIVVRDNYLFGQNGIQEKYKTCLTKMSDWLQEWTLIFSTYDLKDQVDMNTVQVQIQNMLTRQISSAEDIKIDCQKISQEVDLAKSFLLKIEDEKYSRISAELGITDKVSQLKSKIFAELENYKVTPVTKVKRVDYIVRLSKKAIKAKLKNEIMNKIRVPLEKSIAELNNIIAVSNVIDPILIKVSNAENQMNNYVLNMRYFAATKLMPEIQKSCQEAFQVIEKNTYPKRYFNQYFSRIQTLCKASDSHVEDLKNLKMQPYEFVYHYAKLVSANIKIDCKAIENSITCNKISYLNSVVSEKYKEIPLETLNYIENEWAQIYDKYKIDM